MRRPVIVLVLVAARRPPPSRASAGRGAATHSATRLSLVAYSTPREAYAS